MRPSIRLLQPFELRTDIDNTYIDAVAGFHHVCGPSIRGGDANEGRREQKAIVDHVLHLIPASLRKRSAPPLRALFSLIMGNDNPEGRRTGIARVNLLPDGGIAEELNRA